VILRTARLGVVDDQVLAGSGADGQVLKAQRQLTDHRMHQVLDLGCLGPHIMASP
jgi:hypothetical protein